MVLRFSWPGLLERLRRWFADERPVMYVCRYCWEPFAAEEETDYCPGCQKPDAG